MAVSTEKIWEEFGDSLEQFIIKRVQNEHDAEDIRQEVFRKFHTNIDKLKDENKLYAWIYQITRNAIIDHYRNRKFMVELPDTPEDTVNEPVTGVGAANEIANCLKPMIDHLPEKYRQAITMTEFGGLTQQEMAENLGLSLSGAKARVQRARAKLKEMLLTCCHFEFDQVPPFLMSNWNRHFMTQRPFRVMDTKGKARRGLLLFRDEVLMPTWGKGKGTPR